MLLLVALSFMIIFQLQALKLGAFNTGCTVHRPAMDVVVGTAWSPRSVFLSAFSTTSGLPPSPRNAFSKSASMPSSSPSPAPSSSSSSSSSSSQSPS